MTSIYPTSFEQKIDFTQIRNILSSKCLGTIGKELTQTFGFLNQFETIKKELEETQEFIQIIQEYDSFPLGYFVDARPFLSKAKVEGTFLDVHELFDLKKSLETIRAIVHFFRDREEEEFLRLKAVVKDVQLFPFIYTRIDQIITKHGKIKDSASEELNRIRREILSRQSAISKTMQSILRQAQNNGIVDKDTSISIRDGRAVIPVPAAFKRKIKGIVHDESATGKTAYIEPEAIVETNNAIRELEYAERREIVRILSEFTESIRPHIDDICDSYLILGEIDFIRAKALWAIEINAIIPQLKSEPYIDWIQARHPLLEQNLKKEKKQIVPLNIQLNEQTRILLISGPNAGGKSVCLKTTVLIQYMLQCGLMVPLHSDSIVGVFESLFIDIGDEQSIENDLSTYSSHLLNMKFFLKNCTNKSLIFIDEFGTGTEPILGGAIAESVLNQLNQNGTYGVITTHYTNLKHFASSAKGIVNSAMLYDSHKMEPQFILQIGQPGSSFAFEIARKIGLPEPVLKEAADKIGQDHIDFDKHLREIVRDKRYWENKRQNIRKVEKQLEDLTTKYEQDLQKSKSMRQSIIEEAYNEADAILKNSNKMIEKTIREIRENQANKEKTKGLRKDLEEFKENLEKSVSDQDDKINKKIEKLKQREEQRKKRRGETTPQKITPTLNKIKELKLEVGANVCIKGQENVGEVIEINGNNVIVAFGLLKSTIKKNKLVVISQNKAKKLQPPKFNRTMAQANNKISHQKLNFKPNVDVRGERAEDALHSVQQFIDEAIMVEAKELRILHGKGNGILRDLIRKLLDSEPLIKSFRDEHVQHGGSGITVVFLK